MNLYPIFTRKIAFRLEQMGFTVKKIQQNKKYPQYNVYFFEDTIEFHRALALVTQK